MCFFCDEPALHEQHQVTTVDEAYEEIQVCLFRVKYVTKALTVSILCDDNLTSFTVLFYGLCSRAQGRSVLRLLTVKRSLQ